MSPKKMKKLVLCVHGIGEQQAGDTISHLAGLIEGNDGNRIESESRLLIDKHHEKYKNNDRRFQQHFPCHTIRVESDEAITTYAEVFWADLSRPKDSLLGVAFELIKGILGLGHLVRENARCACSENSWCKKFANLFVFIMHAAVVPLNLLLLLGLIIEVGLGYVEPSMAKIFGVTQPPNVLMIILTGFTLFFGFIWWKGPKNRRSKSYLFRYFARGLFFFSGCLVVLAIVGLNTKDTFTLVPLAEYFKIPYNIDFLQNFKGIDAYALVLVLLLVTSWFAISVLLFILLGQRLFRLFIAEPQNSQNAPSYSMFEFVCAAMALFWLSFSKAFWASLERFIPDETINPLLFNISQAFFSYIVALLIIIFFVAGIVTILRSLRINSKKYTPAENSTSNGNGQTKFDTENGHDHDHEKSPIKLKEIQESALNKFDEQNRLLINRNLEIALVVGIIFIGSLALPSTIKSISTFFGLDVFLLVKSWPEELKFIPNVLDILALIFPLICIAIASYGRVGVAQALGVGKDVITYFKGEPDDANGGAKTTWKYPDRDRINGRFKTVSRTMITSVKPDEVTIISHSLGTVIAVEALKEMCAQSEPNSLFAKSIKKRALVTMGSPISHVFQHYFGCKFRLPGKDLREKIPVWLNIYSIDDFVGTIVGDRNGSWPDNRSVSKSGHTKYWTDTQTLKLIKPLIVV